VIAPRRPPHRIAPRRQAAERQARQQREQDHRARGKGRERDDGDQAQVRQADIVKEPRHQKGG